MRILTDSKTPFKMSQYCNVFIAAKQSKVMLTPMAGMFEYRELKMQTEKLMAMIVLGLLAQAVWADEPIPSWKGQVGDSPKFELENPGYFDVGGGFAYVDKANNLKQSATGFLVTIKAYPKGRWYAPKKKITALQVTQKLNDSATTATAAAATPADKTKSAADATQALNDYLAKQTELFSVVSEPTGSRFSIFYGRSMGNFDSTTIKGNVDALGVAYDIAPEFAMIFGVAFYQANLSDGSFETKHKPIIGIQMNLNAFSAFRGLGGS